MTPRALRLMLAAFVLGTAVAMYLIATGGGP